MLRHNDMNYLMNTSDPKNVKTTCIVKSDKPQLQTLPLLSLLDKDEDGIVQEVLDSKDLEFQFV